MFFRWQRPQQEAFIAPPPQTTQSRREGAIVMEVVIHLQLLLLLLLLLMGLKGVVTVAVQDCVMLILPSSANLKAVYLKDK